MVQHSSTLTHRTIKPPGIFKQHSTKNTNTNTKASSTTSSSSHHQESISINSENQNQNPNYSKTNLNSSNHSHSYTSHSHSHSHIHSNSTHRRSTPLSSIANKFGKWKRRMSNSSNSNSNNLSKSAKSTPTKKSAESSSMTSKKVKYHQPRGSKSVSKPTPEAMMARMGGTGSSRRSSSRSRPQPGKMGPADSSSSNHDPRYPSKGGANSNGASASNYHQSASHMHTSNLHHTHTQRMYDQVVDGMSKMSSHETDEHLSEADSSSRASGSVGLMDERTTATASITMPSYSHSHSHSERSHSLADDGSTIVSELTTDSSYNFHTFSVGDKKFTVDRRYSKIRTVGSGAYGVVISAKDFTSGTNVAIKMVPRAFHDEVDAKRILREIKLLKHFDHENIIGILDMMPPLARHVEDFKDVYIVTDLMETDLHRIIYSKQPLSLEHVQYFLYQILRAVKYLHSANVLHRDLKPSNLLVNSNCDLKVCDFGLARGITPNHDEDLEQNNGGSMLLTEYVVTRWYRAPEIMLACHEYSKPVDIWSAGCIFAELLNRKPYLPGDDYIDQLTLITEKLGKPSERDMDFITSEKAKRFLRKLPDRAPKPLMDQFPSASVEAIDLLSKMLTIHPIQRIKIEDALAHPFFASLHNPDAEPVAHAPFDFRFEDEELRRVRLQELIWEEVGQFRPSCLPVPRRMNVIPKGHDRSSRNNRSSSNGSRYHHA